MSGSYICPAWGYDLRAVACKHRALDWLRSNRTRRQLCNGPDCPHYRPEWEAKVAAERAERPKCGCGEPLEPGQKKCDDCRAWDRQRIGRRHTARLNAKKAANKGVEDSLKGVEMAKEETGAKHRFGDRPLPKGFTVSRTGNVYKESTQYVPCQNCQTGWKTVKSEKCQACTPPKTAEDLARMRQARAAKRVVEPKAAPKPKNKLVPCPVKEPVGSELKELVVHVFGGFSVEAGELNDTQRAIWDECEALAEMLMAKNKAYGNSALEPLRIFSKANPEEQLRVRLDDKLSRLMRGEAAGEDVEQDLMGYLVLLRVQRRLAKREAA